MKITKETTIAEIVEKNPEAAEILMNHGFHCIGCPMSMQETIEQGAASHGLSEKETKQMLREINRAVEKKE